jgi:hypothetical protein
VFLGNPCIGKSLMHIAGLQLLSSPQHQWRNQQQLPTYIPNVFDVYRTKVTVDG